MDLQIGDIQETALITLAIRASETDRPNARIKDLKAKEITLAVKGTASAEEIRKAVESAGFVFKGKL